MRGLGGQGLLLEFHTGLQTLLSGTRHQTQLWGWKSRGCSGTPTILASRASDYALCKLPPWGAEPVRFGGQRVPGPFLESGGHLVFTGTSRCHEGPRSRLEVRAEKGAAPLRQPTPVTWASREE